MLGVVHAGTNMLNSSGFEFGARLAVRVRHADGSHQLFGVGEAGMVQRGTAAVLCTARMLVCTLIGWVYRYGMCKLESNLLGSS